MAHASAGTITVEVECKVPKRLGIGLWLMRWGARIARSKIVVDVKTVNPRP